MRFIIFILLVFTSNICAYSQKIIWLTDDEEDLRYLKTKVPYSIGLDTVNLILNKIENYEIEVKLSSVSRINHELKNTSNTCVGNRLKTQERIKYGEFSLPINIHPTPRLYFQKSNVFVSKELLASDGTLLSLSSLMNQNPQKKLALVKDISYGTYFDEQIYKLNERFKVFFNVDNRYKTNSKLLLEHLVDITIDYPTQIRRQLVSYNRKNTISSLRLSGTKDYISSHIVCSRSNTGKGFITETNKLLTELYTKDDFKAAHIRFLQKSELPLFLLHFEKVFGN